MPIYEYRCPDGHLFEVFHRMSEDGPTECEVCGESPVERVLHPVPVFFKGKGFYSTDYGSGKRKKDSSSSDSGDSSSSTGSDSASSSSSGGETASSAKTETSKSSD